MMIQQSITQGLGVMGGSGMLILMLSFLINYRSTHARESFVRSQRLYLFLHWVHRARIAQRTGKSLRIGHH